MFTGLIQAVGEVISLSDNAQELTLSYPISVFSDLKEGDSVCVNGVCSTVLDLQKHSESDGHFRVDYLPETLAKTTMGLLKEADKVNLEPSLRASDRLGGHVVTGHIDSVAEISKVETIGETWVYEFTYDHQFKPYIISKGSIAVDGISLTVVDPIENRFQCHIIPHTGQETTLTLKKEGMMVNLEYDLTGKYLYRFYQLEKGAQ
tara:strand:- start:225 stop:839 length:615 start_codon:yes stop_codon:yes gene_type:complete